MAESKHWPLTPEARNAFRAWRAREAGKPQPFGQGRSNGSKKRRNRREQKAALAKATQ